MNPKQLLWPAFIVMVALQIILPLNTVFKWEDVASNGKLFKYKTAPVDPADPYRGRYITLSFDPEEIVVQDGSKWSYDEVIYLEIGEDSAGYLRFSSASKTEPEGNSSYIKSRVQYIDYTDTNKLHLYMPFNRYYMNEVKAPKAESVYNEGNRQLLANTYAEVRVKDGRAVVTDVIVNGQSVNDL